MIKLDAIILISSVLLTLYSLFDCGRTDQDQVRSIPKWAWLVVILVFEGLGGLAWLIAGRPKSKGGSGKSKRKPRIIPPDDDPDFLSKL